MNELADGFGLGSESVGGGCPFLLARRRGPVPEFSHRMRCFRNEESDTYGLAADVRKARVQRAFR